MRLYPLTKDEIIWVFWYIKIQTKAAGIHQAISKYWWYQK